MASEITEEEEDHNPYSNEAEKIKIRQIINYQKTLYSSSSSLTASSSSSKSSSLLDLMREGSTSLRRLFDMEHTSLADHFNEYSVSPIIKPILLWGSDDEARDDPWAEITRTGGDFGSKERVVSSRSSCDNRGFEEPRRLEKKGKRKLIRTKTYMRLPRFSLWRCGGFRFKFKLRLIRKVRVLIRGRIF